ncbi:Adaptive-response sensory-kinase SasA [Flavobacterium bizetiae]|uniref:histidine kinase n=1 Tax=Flavobacterium bizetiae TaxID=2704140 RepID=A0A6J4GYD6_9FLAO|nr:HAMP domain-containing sensor histidine kinase [Flavobacterium bizetiae]CAA9203216.1 Adaptive-response sensory-kinase SasA [Flavobacterium bizetiae]CAD5342163.1 Adaptive-response sensory-kinase SasA [Flavobacterium bizetiae]CAD5349189.1 Adaptive-response sensory-kinase SasA [Flavobacterium bizetiae]
MTLKNRISLLVSLLFTILFGLASTLIFVLYSNFRKDEFRDRLEIKALSNIKLLVNVKEIDNQLLKMIDQNSINKLYDEKTLVFDSNYKLIYSSIDDAKIKWSVDDLKYLKKNKTFFKKQGNYEVYGVFYDTKDRDFYALISATDNFGQRRLLFLRYTLIVSYIFFTCICWVVTSITVKKLMSPLNTFHQKIKNINENNLDTRVESKRNKDEIDLIANEFNFMMDRIEISYQRQKEFTANASHELRTPLSRITSQIENVIADTKTSNERKSFLKNILSDVNQLTELINSLLILSKIDNKNHENNEVHRMDEILFSAIENLNKTYPEFVILFDIEENDNLDVALEIKGNKNLLEIALSNVLKNACVYSDNKQAKVVISTQDNNLIISVSNTGETLNEEEQKNLFQPFMRGKNSKGTSGFGLGLRIVQRILTLHNASITYSVPKINTNLFQLFFHL